MPGEFLNSSREEKVLVWDFGALGLEWDGGGGGGGMDFSRDCSIGRVFCV